MTDESISRWFLNRPRRGQPSPIDLGNDIEPYIDYDRYYSAAAASISGAEANSTIIIAGWAMDLGTPVTEGGSPRRIGEMLAEAGKRRVNVYVLLSGHLGHPNGPVVEWLNRQMGCTAIADERVRFAGCFHQKALVVTGSQMTAFVGGMDFASDRLANPSIPGSAPWHDVHVKITGPAAAEVYRTLASRLETHPSGVRKRVPRVAIGNKPKKAVQVVRTYGNPRTGATLPSLHRGLRAPSILDAWKGREHLSTQFSFAPDGDSSIHDLLVRGIQNTTSTIYIEDQYFVASANIGRQDELIRTLAETVSKPNFKHLLVLTTGVGTIQNELCQTNKRRRDLWRKIAAQYPDRVSVWAYKFSQPRCSWVHSKMWIFDDQMAVVGSANFNRRGLTHDGELAVGFVDAEDKHNAVRDLRVKLWMKHLPTSNYIVPSEELHDFEKGRKYWADTKDTYIERMDLEQGDPNQPDILIECKHNAIIGASGPAAKAREVGNLALELVCRGAKSAGVPVDSPDAQWNFALDPDGS